MFQCPDCDFTTDVRERYAGHRSGHVRRQEATKRIIVAKDHKCRHCGQCFESGPHLAGHLSLHRPKRPVNWGTCNNGRRKVLLLEERGHQCERCGRTEWEGHPIPLDMDHIDGNTENNDKANLRLLCCNCHALTPTYKGKNIGRYNTKTAKYRRAYHAKTRVLVA